MAPSHHDGRPGRVRRARSPSWSHDERLVAGLGWGGTTIAEVAFDPYEFRVAQIRGDELGVYETGRASLIGPVDEPGNPWAVPACHDGVLVFGGEFLRRLSV
jgi:hypothetical protein